MKKALYILTCLVTLLPISCTRIDNYQEPQETLYGKILDKETGESLQCEAGSNGIRIKLMEYNWDENPTPYYFYSRMDGTFNNTKIFKGTYGILVEGPFVPLQQYDEEGNMILDGEVIKEIKGTVNQNFEVEPFLRINWVTEPYLGSDGKIKASVRISRGTDNTDYQLDVDRIALFISSTKYVGNNDYLTKYSRVNSFEGEEAEALLGTELELEARFEVPAGRTWFVRAAARTNYTVAGTSRYNYSTVMEVK